MKNKTKNATFAFRISQEDLSTIRNKAEQAEMSVTDFFTNSALGKNIILINDLTPMISQLKAIGNNLNQLTTLANLGRVEVINLTETKAVLDKIHTQLAKISEVL